MVVKYQGSFDPKRDFSQAPKKEMTNELGPIEREDRIPMGMERE